MKNFSLACFISAICLLSQTNCLAQTPLILGGVLETGNGFLDDSRYGTGIVRITPFVGAWLNNIGFARLGYSTGSENLSTSVGESVKLEQRDISLQLGASFLGSEQPYIALSCTKARSLSNIGDTGWFEWGLGFGHRFVLSPKAAIVAEIEHRWITEHYSPVRGGDVSGRRIQIAFGFAVNPI